VSARRGVGVEKADGRGAGTEVEQGLLAWSI
jgi:hypothetical protein